MYIFLTWFGGRWDKGFAAFGFAFRRINDDDDCCCACDDNAASIDDEDPVFILEALELLALALLPLLIDVVAADWIRSVSERFSDNFDPSI